MRDEEKRIWEKRSMDRNSNYKGIAPPRSSGRAGEREGNARGAMVRHELSPRLCDVLFESRSLVPHLFFSLTLSVPPSLLPPPLSPKPFIRKIPFTVSLPLSRLPSRGKCIKCGNLTCLLDSRLLPPPSLLRLLLLLLLLWCLPALSLIFHALVMPFSYNCLYPPDFLPRSGPF